MHMVRKTSFYLLLGTALLLPSMSHAAVYKCLDERDRVSYTESECTEGQQVDKILRVQVNQRHGGVECGVLKNFAAEVGLAIEAGKSAQQTAEPWGGEEALSPLALRVLRSVYDYQRSENFKQTEDSIDHEAARCMAREYGHPSCADFPVDFVSAYGGCEAAKYATVRSRRMLEARAAMPQPVQAEPELTLQERVSLAVAQAHERDRQQRNDGVCEDLRSQLSLNQENLQRDMQPALRQAYEMERRELKNALRGCR